MDGGLPRSTQDLDYVPSVDRLGLASDHVIGHEF